MLLPDLINNAVEVNRSGKYATRTRPYGHVLMAVYEETDSSGGKQPYAVRLVVEHNTDKKTNELIEFGVIGALHAANAKKCTHSTVALAVQILPRHPL